MYSHLNPVHSKYIIDINQLLSLLHYVCTTKILDFSFVGRGLDYVNSIPFERDMHLFARLNL